MMSLTLSFSSSSVNESYLALIPSLNRTMDAREVSHACSGKGYGKGEGEVMRTGVFRSGFVESQKQIS